MQIDGSGRVGIGTTSPDANLDVRGSNASILISDSGRTQYWRIQNDETNDALVFNANDTSERMRIDSSGRVGIGVTPASWDPDSGLSAIQLNGYGAIWNYYNNVQLAFNTYQSSTGDKYLTTDEAAKYTLDSGGNHVWYTASSGSANAAVTFSERARIDNSGRLLVGTSTDNASYKLQVVHTDSSGVLLGCFNGGTNYLTTLSSNGSEASKTIVTNGQNLFTLNVTGYDGSANRTAATISAFVDSTPGANDMPSRLVFSTTADGASSPTERMRLSSNGFVYAYGTYTSTTAGAANVNVDANGLLRRSTSSAKYKTDIETLQDSYADALLGCRPVWYRSTCENDNSSWGWWGFIAEEVAAIDPRLVQWKTVEVTYDEKGSAVETPCDPEPEGVAYDRFVPHLLNLIKRQQQAIEDLQVEVAALKAS
jgi:hypothetical protein